MGLYLILMGVQGAGKGVQAQYISERYGIPHVSTGDIFRSMKTRKDPLALRVQELMASGKLINDEMTNEIVADRLSQPDAANGVLLDGYPRNIVQADFLKQYLAERDESVMKVLLLELNLYTAFKRAFGRVTSMDGTSYNIYFLNDGLDIQFVEHPEKGFPPRIDVTHKDTGEKLNRRPDDANAVGVVNRIDTYLETTMPLIEYYQMDGVVQNVDANQSIEDVAQEIAQIIDEAQA